MTLTTWQKGFLPRPCAICFGNVWNDHDLITRWCHLILRHCMPLLHNAVLRGRGHFTYFCEIRLRKTHSSVVLFGKSSKKECRKAERRWRKNKLQVHYDIFRKRLQVYNSELKRARQSFFSVIINKNSNNAFFLFTVDKLTITAASVPPELLSTKSFASFVTDKILKIRQTVCNSVSGNMAMRPVPPQKTTLVNVAHFHPLDNATLTEIVEILCLLSATISIFKDVLTA